MSEYQELLTNEGEVAIGEFARQRRRQRVLLALVGVGLIAAAVTVAVVLWPAQRSHVDGFAPLVECAQCHERTQHALGPTERFPLICGKCGQKAVYPLLECRVCGLKFISPGDPEAKCTRCGSPRVGSARAGSP